MRHAAMRTRVRGSMRRSNEGVGWCQVHNDASECVRVCGMACRIVLHREIRLHTESHHLATTLPRCRIARRCSACCNALPCQKQQRTPAARGRARQHMQGATTFLHTHTCQFSRPTSLFLLQSPRRTQLCAFSACRGDFGVRLALQPRPRSSAESARRCPEGARSARAYHGEGCGRARRRSA